MSPRSAVPTVLVLLLAGSAGAADLQTRKLVAEGNIQYRQLRFDKALEQYDKAIQKDAKYAIAHNNRGLALHKLGKLDEAAAALRQAIDLDSKKPAFHLNLGKVLAARGDLEAAAAALSQALVLNRNLAAAVYNQAWVLEAQGKLAEAAQRAAELKTWKNLPAWAVLLDG